MKPLWMRRSSGSFYYNRRPDRHVPQYPDLTSISSISTGSSALQSSIFCGCVPANLQKVRAWSSPGAGIFGGGRFLYHRGKRQKVVSPWYIKNMKCIGSAISNQKWSIYCQTSTPISPAAHYLPIQFDRTKESKHPISCKAGASLNCAK